MTNNEPSGFRIGYEDQEPDIYAAPGDGRSGKRENRRIDKLNRRITILAILLPLLLAAMAAAAYLELQKRLQTVQVTGVAEAEAVAASLESKLTELNTQYEALKQSMEEQEEPMTEAFLVFERTTASLREELASVKEGIDQLAETKLDRSVLQEELNPEIEKINESIETAVVQVQETVAPVQEAMETLRLELAAQDERVATELITLTEGLATTRGEINAVISELNKTKADLVDVLEDTVTRKTLDAAITVQTKPYQSRINSLSRQISENDRTLRTLNRKIADVETLARSLARRREPMGTPAPGTVIEQDIQ